MLRPGTFPLTLLLALLTGLGPLSVDMYLASLPEIGRLLGAPTSQVQLTISVYLIGFALGQICYGPLSDRHGRRPVLLGAISLYLAATLACALAPSIELLITGRFCQALGGSGTIVLARAIVRDMYDGSRIGRELSRMAAIMAIAPLIAPLLGGGLQTLFGWRSNFFALLAIGGTAAVMVFFLLPETLRQRVPEAVSPLSILRAFRVILRNRMFVVHLGFAACCMAGLFAWISTAAFVLQDIYSLSPMAFGLSFAVGSAGYMLGTMTAARFVPRWGGGLTIGYGTAAMAAGGLGMIAVLACGGGAVGVSLAAALYLVGMGMTLPQAQAGALLPFPDRAGAASSLLGATTQVISAALGALLGHVLATTAWPLALAMGGAGSLGLALWWSTRRLRGA